jgi:hypothetical protein
MPIALKALGKYMMVRGSPRAARDLDSHLHQELHGSRPARPETLGSSRAQWQGRLPHISPAVRHRPTPRCHLVPPPSLALRCPPACRRSRCHRPPSCSSPASGATSTASASGPGQTTTPSAASAQAPGAPSTACRRMPWRLLGQVQRWRMGPGTQATSRRDQRRTCAAASPATGQGLCHPQDPHQPKPPADPAAPAPVSASERPADRSSHLYFLQPRSGHQPHQLCSRAER